MRLTYQQVLAEEAGAVEFTYPLGADGLNRAPLESVSVDVRFESSVDLRSVLCASHSVEVRREGGRGARATYEATFRRETREMRIWFGRSADEVALTVLSTLPRAGEGTVLAAIAPPVAVKDEEAVPKDVVYVLDTSGSMAGVKLDRAKGALRAGLAMLREGDRFGIVSFAGMSRSFRGGLVSATAANRDEAVRWIDALDARGGTALDAGLRAGLGLGTPGRLFLVVLLTDGRPTIGPVVQAEDILASARRANTAHARVYTFGVGQDLDVALLDRIAEDTGGRRHYIAPHEEIGAAVTAFLRTVDTPVLTDVRLEIGEGVEEIYPHRMPDLYAGSDVVVLGRYAKAGERTLRLVGKRGEKEEAFEFRLALSAESGHPYLERLWAQRKVAFLLDEMRLHGQDKELVDEVVRLGTLHALVTPFTAGLVVEDGSRPRPSSPARFSGGGHGGSFRGPNGGVPPGYRMPSDPEPSGPTTPLGPPPDASAPKRAQPPTEQSRDLRDRKEARVVEEIGTVRAIEDKSFVWTAEGLWTDTAYDGKSERTEIEAWSDDYFALLKRSDLVARYLSVGERVVVILDGTAYEIVPPP